MYMECTDSTVLLASGASLPSRTAGTIFCDIYIYIYMYPTMHFGPDICPRATCKRNRPCLFRSPSMRSIQLVYHHGATIALFH